MRANHHFMNWDQPVEYHLGVEAVLELAEQIEEHAKNQIYIYAHYINLMERTDELTIVSDSHTIK